MLSEKDLSLLFETLLSAPGMNDVVKLDLRIPRKNVLLLAKVIESGLQNKPGGTVDALIRVAGDGCGEDLKQVGIELLQKAGLSDMNSKLHILQLPVKEK